MMPSRTSLPPSPVRCRGADLRRRDDAGDAAEQSGLMVGPAITWAADELEGFTR